MHIWTYVSDSLAKKLDKWRGLTLSVREIDMPSLAMPYSMKLAVHRREFV